MTARIDMLRRLAEIADKRIELAHKMAPFYQAAHKLAKPTDFGSDVNYEQLETHPEFRPLWEEDHALKDEFLKLQMDLM